jgi:CheY-like chemotaxis protein
MDKAGRVFDSNMEAVSLFEAESKEYLEEHFFNFMPEYQPTGRSSRNEAMARILAALESGSQHFEWIHRTTSGRIIPAEITLVRVNWHDGYRFAGFVRDMTEIKANEEKRKEAKRQTEQALSQAEYYSKAKSDFISHISLEMRMPMNAIMSMTAAAKTANNDDQRTDFLEQIDVSCHRLLGLINNLQDMAEINIEDFELAQKKSSFKETTDMISAAISAKAGAKEQGLTAEIDPDLPTQDSSAGKATLPLSGRHILAVDDAGAKRHTILLHLRKAGAAADGAGNGEDAIKKVFKNKYDLVLMDLHMPGMNGFEAARRIRDSGQPGADSLLIIGLTADTRDEVISRCLEAGMNGYIGKPVSAKIMIDTIAKKLAEMETPQISDSCTSQ